MLVLLLLAIASPRILRLNEIQMNYDEPWSIYGGFGSWSEILHWNDINWPPLNLLFIHVLVKLVGFQPLALRYLHVLMFLLGASVFYRVVQKETDRNTALFSVLTYGGIGYLIYASVELRGYATMLAVLPFVWLSAQGFRRWPSPRRACLCLAASSALALYVSYLSAVPVAFFFLYVLWMQPERFKQNAGYLFLAAALCFLLLVPLIDSIVGLGGVRNSIAYKRFILEPWILAEAKVFRIWFAHGGSYQRNGNWLYILVLALGFVGLIWKRRFSRYTAFIVFFSIGLLPLLHLLNPILGIYSHKSYLWILLGVSATLGHMLAMLPKLGQWCAASLLTLVLFIPQPRIFVAHLSGFTSFGASLQWLQGHWHAGDAMIVTQAESCLPPTPNPWNKEPIEYWNQLLRTYFPTGVSIVEWASTRRVWVLSSDGARNSVHSELSTAHYISGLHFASADCHLQLYESAPDRVGISFDNGLRYHGAQFLIDGAPQPPGFAPQLHEGEDFGVRIWWTVDSPISAPHRSGFIIRDADGAQLLAEYGVPQLTQPADATHDFRSWQPGQVYLEERKLKLPYPLKRQDIELSLVLIAEADGTIISAPNVDDHGYLPLFRIRVDSW